jgi:hypothetical protein
MAHASLVTDSTSLFLRLKLEVVFKDLMPYRPLSSAYELPHYPYEGRLLQVYKTRTFVGLWLYLC